MTEPQSAARRGRAPRLDVAAESNPLLGADPASALDRIAAAHMEPAIRQLVREGEDELTAIAVRPSPDWQSVVIPVELARHRLATAWSIIEHLQMVAGSDDIRHAHRRCLGLMADWNARLAQDASLHRALQAIASREWHGLDTVQRTLLDELLRMQTRAGVTLTRPYGDRLKSLKIALADLQARYAQNLADWAQAHSLPVAQPALLAGLPSPLVERARARAHDKGQSGWDFAIDAATCRSLLVHAQDSDLRRACHRLWTGRAASGGFDNSAIVSEILALRHEMALLLGFPTYADYMVPQGSLGSVADVRGFLLSLRDNAQEAAERELDILTRLAGGRPNAWDILYYSEAARTAGVAENPDRRSDSYDLPTLLCGIFALLGRLFGIRVEASPDTSTYYPDVRRFDVFDADGARRGSFLLDLFGRPGKSGQAWMANLVGRCRLADRSDDPLVCITMNLARACRDARLAARDIETLLHELGHAMHHILTRVDYPGLAGYSGVPWDSIEIPSRLFEGLAQHPEVDALLSGGHNASPTAAADLDAPAPRFTAIKCLQQIEFALFDLEIHAASRPLSYSETRKVACDVRSLVRSPFAAAHDRLPNYFDHIFAGHYAGSYYGYLWSDVLAADALSGIEDGWKLDRDAAKRFQHAILEVGGTTPPLAAFAAFRGRAPTIDAYRARLTGPANDVANKGSQPQ